MLSLLSLLIIIVTVFTVLILCYFIFLRDLITIKTNDNLQEKILFLNNLLNNNVNKYLERLKCISNKNLSYVQKYNSFLNIFNELSKEYKEISIILVNIQNDVFQKHFSNVRKQISINKKRINIFEKKLNNISSELSDFFNFEEEQKYVFSDLMEKIKNIHSVLESKNDDGIFFYNRYKTLFKVFDDLHNEFNEYLDLGEFEKSKNVLDKIVIFVNNFVDFDNFVSVDIYNKIAEIKSKVTIFIEKFNDLVNNGHDLNKLVLKQILSVKVSLLIFFKCIKKLNFSDAKKELLFVDNEMDQLYSLLFEEKKAREDVLVKIDQVNKSTSFLEQKFRNFCIYFLKINKIYFLNDEINFKFNNLKKKINSIKILKNIDFNDHKKKCYYLIIKKIYDIKEKIFYLNNEIIALEKNIMLIKNDIEKYYVLIYKFYFDLKKVEKIALNDDIYSEYEKKIDKIYTSIDDTMDLLTIIPIDINKIYENFEFLKTCGESVINQINFKDYNLKTIENSVLYINGNNYDEALFIKNNVNYNFFNKNFENVLDAIKRILNK